jgi:hypothetical protein
MEKGDFVSPCAGTGFFIDEIDVLFSCTRESGFNILRCEREVVDTGTVPIEVSTDRSVIDRFEEFKVAVPTIEKDDAHTVEFLLVGDGNVEQITEQRCERSGVVSSNTGVIEAHGRMVTQNGNKPLQSRSGLVFSEGVPHRIADFASRRVRFHRVDDVWHQVLVSVGCLPERVEGFLRFLVRAVLTNVF